MIDPKKLTVKEQSKELSETEKAAIAQMEQYIDNGIRESFEDGKASVADFLWARNELPAYMELKYPRRKIVTEILMDKYREGGWRVKYEVGEDDGPNRPGVDFWIFTAK